MAGDLCRYVCLPFRMLEKVVQSLLLRHIGVGVITEVLGFRDLLDLDIAWKVLMRYQNRIVGKISYYIRNC